MKNQKGLMLPLYFALIFMVSSTVIGGVVAVLPPIPRVVTGMNHSSLNKLTDSLRVKCGILDFWASGKIHASQWGICPGFNVESKIRWDWGPAATIAAVTSAKQTNGDQRELERVVGVFSCGAPNGWSVRTTVVKVNCQAQGTSEGVGSDVGFLPLLNNFTDCINEMNWSFVGSNCILDEAVCNTFQGYWYFTGQTCGYSQSQCSGIGFNWNWWSPECSENDAPCWEQQYECPQGLNWNEWACQCTGQTPSPIVVDVLGNGFNLTSAASGVNFDVNGDGKSEHVSWTAAASDDAFLVYDRDRNGLIERGVELFGNYTPQSKPAQGNERHGFLALGEYDKHGNGGNNNGEIDQGDRVFSSLRLWQDLNHNGVSERNELFELLTLGLSSVELNCKESRKTDRHGNQFRYRSKVKDTQGQQLGRWAWDVFLVEQ